MHERDDPRYDRIPGRYKMPLRTTTPILCIAALFAVNADARAQAAPASAPTTDRAPGKWEATLRPTRQNSASAVSAAQNKTSGNVQLTELAPDRMRVQLSLSTRSNEAVSLQWAVLPGACGSNVLPLVGVHRFPVIQVGPNGRADLNLEFALTIPEAGEFHVNVYQGGTSYYDILTCGNLKRRR